MIEGVRSKRSSLLIRSIHESRHQKGFYFNRVTDARPVLYPSGFVKQDFHRKPLYAPFGDHGFQEIFDLILSVGYELSFLQFVKKRDELCSYSEALEIKIARKRGFFYSMLGSAEHNRDALTPLGIETLDTFLDFMES